MNILVIGSGGREHALGMKIKESKKVDNIYFAPGNGGTSLIGNNIDIASNDIEGLLNFAKSNNIDMTVVGPEEPLCNGIVDVFVEGGLRIFGPDKECSKFENSKIRTKEFLFKNNIPTGDYEEFASARDAKKALSDWNYPLVVKADGLAAGKGVAICNTIEEANGFITQVMENKIFGDSGSKIIFEEYLDGAETSIIALVSNGVIKPLETAKDYKKIFEDNLGPNTGGMGSFSPSNEIDDEMMNKINDRILTPFMDGLKKENLDYKGIIFVGIMIVAGEPFVLEFNVRFGDPETQSILARMENDIVDVMESVIDGTLSSTELLWSNKTSMTVVLASGGYPSEYKKGYTIVGLDDISDLSIIHGGTKSLSDKIVTNGGRVLNLVTLGDSIEDCRKKIYSQISKVKFQDVYYRGDIGY